MQELIYPIHYFYRGGVSDKETILANMACIPPDKQREVADNYERLFLAGGPKSTKQNRIAANDYLYKMACMYHSKPREEIEANENDRVATYNEFKERMKKLEQESRKEKSKAVPMPSGVKNNGTYTGPSIIEMAEQARLSK